MPTSLTPCGSLDCTIEPSTGDASATPDVLGHYDQIFVACQAHLLWTARRYLRSHEDAEDVVHDAYLRWRGADKSGINDYKAWLTTTVVNLAIDHHRRRNAAAHVSIETASEQLEDAEHLVAGPTELHDWHFALFAAQAMMEELNVAERLVFTMHDVFDYEYADIAKVSAKKVPACRQIAHRARARVASWRTSHMPARAQIGTRLLAAAIIGADINTVINLLTDGLTSMF